MPTRRWLLSRSLLAGAGLALGGVTLEREAIASRVGLLWRRGASVVQGSRQPARWSDTTAPAHVLVTLGNTPLRPINPLIYGVSVATPAELRATGARLNRWGGNPNTRYNWVHGSAWNAARDWEFRNYGAETSAAPVASSVADRFVVDTRRAGATTWMTVPAIGWVARDGDPAHASVSVPPDGGPPVGDAIAGYDPAANRATTSVRSLARKSAAFLDSPEPTSEPVFQDEWIAHLTRHFGAADRGGVAMYAIDNEPDLWPTTHTDVHPVQPDYADMQALFVDYASAIKDVDPSARVTGPGLSGWTSMLYSARDRGTDNFQSHADRRAHHDAPFLAWWLDQMRRHEVEHGRRLLDALDVHYYPQADGVFGPVGDEATRRRRLRSTRSLWDPTYVDESWIGEAVNLIPRLRAWRDELYPGTWIAIGEWNWGGDDSLNGALAIANVLGIFGREGVDMASYWTSPKPGSPGAHAFGLYTDYDGQGHSFGDYVLDATSSAPDDVAVYASRDSASGDVLVVALNHRPDAAIPASFASTASRARWHVYDASDPTRIRDLGPQRELTLNLPPESLSLVQLSA